METLKLNIETLQERDGFIPPGYSYSMHQNLVSHSYKAKCLLINGTLEDGRKVYFFTPSSIISVCTGFLNYEKVDAENSWFEEVSEGYESVKNPLHYKGCSEPSVGIIKKGQIIPSFSEGDEIAIKFKVKRECKNGKFQLFYVKLAS